MKTKKDIQVKICEIENEISKESKGQNRPIVIRGLELSKHIMEWVLEDSKPQYLSGGGFQNSGEWETDGLSGFRG
jgi:hypothetical protein